MENSLYIPQGSESFLAEFSTNCADMARNPPNKTPPILILPQKVRAPRASFKSIIAAMALETNATITPTILMNPRTPRVINDYLPNSAISTSVCARICDCEASQREVAISRDCPEVDGSNRRCLAIGAPKAD
jgi:hypothetical protein